MQGYAYVRAAVTTAWKTMLVSTSCTDEEPCLQILSLALVSSVVLLQWPIGLLLQYSLWLDQHSMDDVLKFIRGALNAAAANLKVDQDEAGKELVKIMTKICSQS